MIWLRPGLSWRRMVGDTAGPAPTLDTAIFDVDGVLIDTSRSYLLAVMHAAEWLVREGNGLAQALSPMVAPEDVARFKLAGGFNSDWDCTRLFAALWTARLREWQGQPEADITLAEWAARAGEAAQAGGGGLAWLQETVPASAIPSAEEARWAHDEYYWGATLCRQLFGRSPRYIHDAPGFVHNEELLLDALLLQTLAGRGIKRFGLVTGREGPEVTWAVHAIARAHESRAPAMPAPARDVVVIDGDVERESGAAAERAALETSVLDDELAAWLDGGGEDAADRAAAGGVGGARGVADADVLASPPTLTWYPSEYGPSLFGAVVAATEVAKPNPRALVLALARLGARGALYVGDTADDLALVLRYRREVQARRPNAPPVLAVMVADGQAAEFFQAHGADIILSRVTELPVALELVAGLAP